MLPTDDFPVVTLGPSALTPTVGTLFFLVRGIGHPSRTVASAFVTVASATTTPAAPVAPRTTPDALLSGSVGLVPISLQRFTITMEQHTLGDQRFTYSFEQLKPRDLLLLNSTPQHPLGDKLLTTR